jgi:hypothetical protein
MRIGSIPDPQNRMYKGLVRQHEGSKLTDRKTRREAAALLSVLAQITTDREKRPAGSAPDAQGIRGNLSAGGKGVSSIRQKTESEVGWVFLGRGEGMASE